MITKLWGALTSWQAMKFCSKCPRKLDRERVGNLCKVCAKEELDKLTKKK